jgi:hypothetical protein
MTGSLMLGALEEQRQMWCFNRGDLSWTNAGGYFRKLDDGKAVESHVAGACG